MIEMKITRGIKIEPPIILLTGADKIGKSTFASQAPKPLFLSTGKELGQLGVDRTDPLTTVDAFAQALEYAAQETEHETCVVDHLSDVEKAIHIDVAARAGVSSIADIGYGKGYLSAMTYWHALWDQIEKVRDSGKCVILISHAKVVRYEPPEGDGYDVWQPEIHTNAKGEGAGTFIRKKVDVIAFAQLETFVKSSDEKAMQKTSKAMTSGRRILRLVGTPGCVAGNRYGLPPHIDLNWNAFAEAMSVATAPKAASAA